VIWLTAFMRVVLGGAKVTIRIGDEQLVLESAWGIPYLAVTVLTLLFPFFYCISEDEPPVGRAFFEKVASWMRNSVDKSKS